jgi:hypothetical protein
VLYAVFSLLSVAVIDHASFRLILLLLSTFVCVNCFLSTNFIFFLITTMSIVTVAVSSRSCVTLYYVVYTVFVKLNFASGSVVG